MINRSDNLDCINTQRRKASHVRPNKSKSKLKRSRRRRRRRFISTPFRIVMLKKLKPSGMNDVEMADNMLIKSIYLSDTT